MAGALRWLFRKKDPPINYGEFLELQAKVRAESRRQDILEDEYLALTDRPTVPQMWAPVEGAEPVLCQSIDWDHFNRWMTAHGGKTA